MLAEQTCGLQPSFSIQTVFYLSVLYYVSIHKRPLIQVVHWKVVSLSKACKEKKGNLNVECWMYFWNGKWKWKISWNEFVFIIYIICGKLIGDLKVYIIAFHDLLILFWKENINMSILNTEYCLEKSYIFCMSYKQLCMHLMETFLSTIVRW